MHFPHFMRRVNRVFTNRVLGTVAWILPPMAMVHHVGRKSKKMFRTPVVAFRSVDGFVIPLTYGRDVDWARNLVNGGGGAVVQMGRRYALRNARIVDRDTAYSHLPVGIRSALWAADLPGFVLLDFASDESSRAASGSKRPPRGKSH